MESHSCTSPSFVPVVRNVISWILSWKARTSAAPILLAGRSSKSKERLSRKKRSRRPKLRTTSPREFSLTTWGLSIFPKINPRSSDVGRLDREITPRARWGKSCRFSLRAKSRAVRWNLPKKNTSRHLVRKDEPTRKRKSHGMSLRNAESLLRVARLPGGSHRHDVRRHPDARCPGVVDRIQKNCHP